MSDEELLREALVDLERARSREKALRQESEALLQGLHALAVADEPDKLFLRLLEVWRSVVACRDAFVLTLEPDGQFRPVASTHPVFEGTVWQAGRLFDRVVSGAPSAVFDVAEIDEWRGQPEPVLRRVKSALHVRLTGPKATAILIGTHDERGRFGRRQVRLADRFAPLASQALLRREAQAQLQEAQKMEAVGRLAGGVAHEINNVLAAINGLASMLRFELPTHASYVADLDNIIEACRRGADLTGNLLGFARKRGFQRQLVDINEIIRSAVDTAERSRVRQRPRFELDLHPSLPTVEGDRNQLRQVVTNLLSNAQDATGPEGVIRLSTSCQDAPVSLRTTFPDLPHCTFVVVRVADTGAGMDDATVARAIEPFFTTKPVGQGIGLGLSMVYGTVRAHRGAVVLDSEQGHGTTVTVWLPCAPTRSES